MERRDGGRRRRRVVGTTRAPTPRSPPVENRERNNSDDEYDSSFVYDCQVIYIRMYALTASKIKLTRNVYNVYTKCFTANIVLMDLPMIL